MNPSSGLAPALILLVDDDPSTVRLLARILDDMGEVIFTVKGEDAVKMVRERKPDIVLLDAEMPGMDGFEVCAAIKGESEFADLPVLFVTSHNDIATEIRALDTGAVDFIHKPPSPPIVRARVRTHLTLKQRNDQLRRQALVDGLTGVANRRAFEQALEQEYRRVCRLGGELSLIMADVDFFKRFNDLYGHAAGDECLKMVASLIASTARRPGEVVARYGGEEFVIILPNCDSAKALRLADKMRSLVMESKMPHETSGVYPYVTASFGVATLVAATFQGQAAEPSCGAEGGVLKLKAAADAALYKAKGDGRNRVAAADVVIGC